MSEYKNPSNLTNSNMCEIQRCFETPGETHYVCEN